MADIDLERLRKLSGTSQQAQEAASNPENIARKFKEVVIVELPSKLEEAARRGANQAFVTRIGFVEITCDHCLKRMFGRLPLACNISCIEYLGARLIYDYCKSQGLNPYVMLEDVIAGEYTARAGTTPHKGRYYLYVKW